MDDGLKQRVVGAVIIIALGVVFIPKIFNEPGLKADIFGANIPPVPSIADINVNPQYSTSAEKIQQQVDSIRQQALLGVEAGEEGKPVSRGNLIEPPLGQTNSNAASVLPADPHPESQAKTKSPLEGEVWTIQLGSFNKESNATTLRDKIRKKGMRAYIERSRNKGLFVYRVYVGPDLRKDDAKSTLKQLKQQFGLEGFVVRYQLG